MPLAISFALYAAIAARYDVEGGGPSYQDQELLAALDRVAAGLKTPNPKARKPARSRRPS